MVGQFSALLGTSGPLAPKKKKHYTAERVAAVLLTSDRDKHLLTSAYAYDVKAISIAGSGFTEMTASKLV